MMRRVNNLIKILTYSDVLLISGWGLVSPIFAVFLTSRISGGNLELVGLAVAVYWIIKAFLQIPVARFLDQKKGEVDDMLVMAIGSLLVSITPFLYINARTATHVLVLQVFYGFGAALITPGWMAIFTRHVDQHKEAEEWSIYNSMVGLGSALAGGLGGFLAEKFGFQLLFLIVGVICIAGTSLLYFVYQDIRMAERKSPKIFGHSV